MLTKEQDESESGTNDDYKANELSSMSLHVREIDDGKLVSR